MTSFDPFSPVIPGDYEKLAEDFGIKRITPGLASRLPDSYLFRRNIVFAHRDLERVLDARDQGKPFAMLTGIKPSNHFHVGNKLVADQMLVFQQMGARVFYAVADVEAYHANRQSLSESKGIAESNIADLLAMGISEESFFYFQSSQPKVKLLGYLYARDVTNNMLKAVYGEKQIGYYLSALVQVGDILLPEQPEFGGPKPVVVPVGLDQDPHIRLSRDIAGKHGLVVPSSTYHRFMRSLTGSEKMSKSEPAGMISLSEDPKTARKKVMRAFTGGRPTVAEQKKEGGNPRICPVYDLLLYLDPDDRVVRKRAEDCVNGRIMCGECKRDVAERVARFLQEHQQKREEKLPVAREIVERISRDCP